MSENTYEATAAAAYGPRWQDVIKIIQKARKLTSKQFNRVVAFAAKAAGREAAWSVAWNDARNAAGQDIAWAAGEFGA